MRRAASAMIASAKSAMATAQPLEPTQPLAQDDVAVGELVGEPADLRRDRGRVRRERRLDRLAIALRQGGPTFSAQMSTLPPEEQQATDQRADQGPESRTHGPDHPIGVHNPNSEPKFRWIRSALAMKPSSIRVSTLLSVSSLPARARR